MIFVEFFEQSIPCNIIDFIQVCKVCNLLVQSGIKRKMLFGSNKILEEDCVAVHSTSFQKTKLFFEHEL